MSRSPLATFLPGVNASDGPFALLGIAPEDCTASNIDAALRARLRTIDEHRHGNTPEADELRAALHTAAAHLHHPTIRAAAIERFGGAARATQMVPTQAPAPAPAPVSAQAATPTREAGAAAAARPAMPAAVPAPIAPSAAAPAAMNGASAKPPVLSPGGTVRLPPEEEAFRDLVIQVLVHSGGWNETAKRRLAAITHLHGRPIRHLQGALRLVALTGPSRKYRPVFDAALLGGDELHTPDPTLAPIAAPPTAKRSRHFLLAASVLFTINSIVLLFVLVGIVRERSAMRAAFEVSSAMPMAAAEGDAATMSSAEARQRLDGARDAVEDEPIARLAAIRGATRGLRSGGGSSMTVFNANFLAMARGWEELDAATLQAFVTAVSDFVAEASRHDPALAIRAIDTIAGASDPITRLSATPRTDQLRPAAFSIAMLSRLRRDRDLPATVGAALQRRLEPFVQLSDLLPGESLREASFEDGLGLALRALAARITPKGRDAEGEPSAALWRAWLAIAAAGDGPRAGRIRLDALEHLLAMNRDLHGSPAALESARQLTLAIDWLDPVASRRLLRWHDAEAFGRDDLNTMLGWLAASMPDRIGTDLILPASALPAERAEARDRLATALGAAVRPASEFDEALVARGNALIAEAATLPRQASNPRALTLAAALASFNEASAKRWIQDRAGAEAALANASSAAIEARVGRSPGAAGPPDLGALTAPATGNDGAWALRVLQSQRDRDTLAGLMNQIANVPRTLGPADAGVLVDVALAERSTPIRDAAQRAIRRYADELPLLEAMLQHTAQGRRGLDRLLWEVARTITGADLPHWSEQRFALEARRALLAAHIAHIAEAREPGIEALSQELRRSYAETARSARVGAGLRAGPGEERPRVPPASGARPDPAQAATALADTYQTIASLASNPRAGERSLGAIATRRRARLAVGEDGVQRFHAEQVAAAELLAHIVAEEQPALRPEIERVLRLLDDARVSAASITHQLVAAEAAMAELWIMRLGYHEARRMVPERESDSASAGEQRAGAGDRPARADSVRPAAHTHAIRVVP